MSDSMNKLQEQLRLLAASFADNLPARIAEIEAMWQQVQSGWNVEVLQTLHRNVHSLTGSGKTFGFPDLSVTARVLEQDLKGLLQSETQPDAAKSAEIMSHLLAMKCASEIKKPIAEGEKIQIPDREKFSVPVPSPSKTDLVFVVDDNVETAQELALQLRYYGYEVEIFNELNIFRTAIKEKPEAIVLMDIVFPGNKMGGINTMKEIQKDSSKPIRVIFVSAYDDLTCRLGAVRAGGLAYFTKPINPAQLIDKIDLLTKPGEVDPFRILIVDDSPTTLNYHAAILESVGMMVKKVLDPLKVMETLLEFNPDIILMDLYMPECSGIELAGVVRQLENFVSTPIVYLSSEDDSNTQLEAMSLGGDDFLVKPIDPHQLISSVTSRVKRARVLHSFMVHDGLTGLFNHTTIKEQLEREFLRSNRSNAPLSFAMIDIDFFKKVNDTYGHAMGDRVIKSLARLLKQRLRGTDTIGRYGGEEFAAILLDTDAVSAAKVIDQIRSVFSQIVHLSEDKEFSVSFSCGVADNKHFTSAASLSEAADKALYQAKHKGRNQVIMSSDASGDDNNNVS